MILERKLVETCIQQESMEDRRVGLCPVVDLEKLLKENEDD